MKEQPILFSGPMVRAILEGRKTQTRRVCKVQPKGRNYIRPHDRHGDGPLPGGFVEASYYSAVMQDFDCPYGQPGDRLWVRETFKEYSVLLGDIDGNMVNYRADENGISGPWKPSIFMPRKYCRLILEVKAVRVERLQDISEEDAQAEGIAYQDGGKEITQGYLSADGSVLFDTATLAFRDLWDSLNAKRAPWESNPWVWVIEFEKAHD